MGAYHEGIATIEEAKALFESIHENHSNMIPAVGINIHEAGTPEIDDVQMDAVKPVYVDEAAKLAAEIDRFSSDFDPYEYKDTVDNWELQVQNIAYDVRSGNSADYKKHLGTVIEESDNIEDVRKTAELQRIEEEERKRRARVECPLLRARLAAKKAIVAANSAVPQRETQRQVQREAVASQRDI